MEEKDLIAQNIAYLRKQFNISQIELAAKLQYSNKNISKWEKGETTPSVFTLKRLAEIFDITVDELISRDLSLKTTVLDSQSAVINDRRITKKLFNMSVKLLYLLMANAILLCFAFIAIFICTILNVTVINKWLILLYILPLSALSVFIFIACIKKRVDLISISLSGWLTALSIYLTFYQKPFMWFIFVISGAFQILITCIMLIINMKLINRLRMKLQNKKDQK